MTEKDFDKLLSVAMVHVAEEDASSPLKTKDELKAAGIPEHKFSPEFERRIATIKRRQHNPVYRWLWKRKNQLIAAIMGIAILGGTAVCSVDAVRMPVVNFFLRFDDSNSHVIADKDSNTGIGKKYLAYIPSYVPEGFDISHKDESPDYIMIEYSNGNGSYYDLTCSLDFESNSVDTEDSTYEEVVINGKTAYFCEKDDRFLAIYYTDVYAYGISGTISKDEIIKIFESI